MDIKLLSNKIIKDVTKLDTILKIILITCILLTVVSLFHSSAYITSRNAESKSAKDISQYNDTGAPIIYPEILLSSSPEPFTNTFLNSSNSSTF